MLSKATRAAVALAVLTPTLLLAPSARSATESVATVPCQSETSYEAGATELCGGELVYRDFVYDDHGADTGYGGSGVGGKGIGNASYADAGAEENTADLLSLRLRLEGDQLQITAHLNTLFKADTSKVVVAIDTDANNATGGGAWPHVNNVRSSGWDTTVLLTGGDPSTNLLTATVPAPAGEAWRVQAVTATADGTVFNVAFRTDESGEFFDGVQAAALRTGDISAFGATVSTADMRAGLTRGHAARTGLRERVYVSEYPMGEGISLNGRPGRPGNSAGLFAQIFNWFGTHQPYVVYVPDKPGPHGIQLMLHGAGNGMGTIVTSASGGFVRTFGDGLNRIVVSPLGRGLTSLYADEAERDVLDVLDRVTAAYDVDPDRVFAGGYSMGGYGTLRLATLYPERFAGFLGWVPATGDCLNGTPLAKGDQRGPLTPVGDPAGQRCDNSGSVQNVFDLLGNTRYVPGGLLFAGADELVWANHAVALTRRYSELKYQHQVWTHPASDHFALAVMDDWAKEAAWSAPLTRARDIGRVTYRADQRIERPDLGITYRGAYWVSGLTRRAEGYVGVDITGGCGIAEKDVTLAYNAGPRPLPWFSQRGDVTGTTTPAAGNQLTGSLENVADVTIDSAAACVDGATVDLSGIVTDGPAVIRFTDGAVRTVG